MVTCTALAKISIHAPLRERPIRIAKALASTVISIHAPLRERPPLVRLLCSRPRFQSTLPCGSDEAEPDNRLMRVVFQSTLPCGSDDYPTTTTGDVINISIHAPLRERQHQKKILLFSFKSSIYCELAQLKYSKILF